MSNIILIKENSYIRQMCGTFILGNKMVTLGIIVPPANLYSL